MAGTESIAGAISGLGEACEKQVLKERGRITDLADQGLSSRDLVATNFVFVRLREPSRDSLASVLCALRQREQNTTIFDNCLRSHQSIWQGLRLTANSDLQFENPF